MDARYHYSSVVIPKRSVHDLEQGIHRGLARWTNHPKLFLWAATTDVILDKVRRCKQ